MTVTHIPEEVLHDAGVTWEIIQEEGMTLRQLTQSEVKKVEENFAKVLLPGVCVAGGSIINLHNDIEDLPKDYDVFLSDHSVKKNVIHNLVNDVSVDEYYIHQETQHSTQIVSIDNQMSAPWFEIINTRTGTPYEIITGFDISACQGAVFSIVDNFGDATYYLLHTEHFNQRNAFFNESKISEVSLKRYIKYVNKGFKFSDETRVKIFRAWFDDSILLSQIVKFDDFMKISYKIQENFFTKMEDSESFSEPDGSIKLSFEISYLSHIFSELENYKYIPNKLNQICEKIVQHEYLDTEQQENLDNICRNEKLSHDWSSTGMLEWIGISDDSYIHNVLICYYLLNSYKRDSNVISDEEIREYVQYAYSFIVEIPELLIVSGRILSFDDWKDIADNLFGIGFNYEITSLLYEYKKYEEPQVIELTFDLSF